MQRRASVDVGSRLLMSAAGSTAVPPPSPAARALPRARPSLPAAIPVPEAEVPLAVQPAQAARQACLDHPVPQAAPQGLWGLPAAGAAAVATSLSMSLSVQLWHAAVQGVEQL